MNASTRRIWPRFFALLLSFLVASCGSDYTLTDQFEEDLTRITTHLSYFKDAHGRYLFVHGANVSGSSKFPTVYKPISYVGKPFPLDEADWNFQQLQRLGFNTLRLVMTWEAIEPNAPGEYDQAYLDFIEAIVAKANEYGIYCLMDMHQDLFSRHINQLFYDCSDGLSLEDEDDIEKAKTCSLPKSQWACCAQDDSECKSALASPNNIVRGDGAPKWVVQLCLPEKEVYGDSWGLPPDCVKKTPKSKYTTDFFPFTLWGINAFLSLDVNRCFATFFAGSQIYPEYKVMEDGVEKNIQVYLQDHFAEAWRQVARRVSKYPNVLGYDILNEPTGIYILFTVYALFWKEASSAPGGMLTDAQVNELLEDFTEELVRQGTSQEAAKKLRDVLRQYDLLPRSTAQIVQSGFYPQAAASEYKPDINAALALNLNFNRNYLQPFHKKVGDVILEEDPDAILFVELSLGLSDTGLAGMMAFPMLRPEGFHQMAYAPHYYTDIYPEIGMNKNPRVFTVEEKFFRDYTSEIQKAIEPSTFSLGNPPTVIGEFGTYFNFGGIETSMAQDYEVSSVVLDRYFESFEKMFLHHIQWCYSPENTMENGEGWNKEDFSLLGPDRKPRSALAYSRPYPRFLSGKPVSMHFYSDFHYYDPDAYIPDPRREFEVTFKTRETDAPSEIFVPPIQYPDGFYVYLSDGHCYYDPDRFILYYYPHKLDPGTLHNLRIRPPYPDYGDRDWKYFFRGKEVITNP